MESKNSLHIFKYKLSLTNPIKDLDEIINPFSFIFSYLLKKEVNCWSLQINIFEEDYYNELEWNNCKKTIIKDIKNNIPTTYQQSSVRAMLAAYNNLFVKLSNQFNGKFGKLLQYDYDDFYQTCVICLYRLYNKGYYCHKNLIEHTCTMEVYGLLRKVQKRPCIISYESILDCNNDSDDNMAIENLIEDINASVEAEEKDLNDAFVTAIAIIKDILKNYISEREIDQIMREYDTKTVRSQTSRKINTIRTKLQSLGIDKDWFNNNF